MKTNTKKNFLKLAMTVVAMLMFTGATGQILTDYSETNATDMYQTVGTNFRVYVQPDPVYSPGYVPGSNTVINPDSYWTFTISAGLTLVTPADISVPINQNWVEVTATTAAAQTITAAEGFTIAGCLDATPQSQIVNVLPAPTAVIAGGNANGWTELVAGLDFYNCDDALAEDLTITITETGVPALLASYAYAIEKKVEEIDVSGVVVAANTNNATTNLVDNTLAAKLAGAADGAVHTVSTGAMPLLLNQDATPIPVRTKYTFTLRKASDASGADGIVSAISHKSDYLGGTATTYPFGADVSVVYVVNLPPVTGPIYHIPNNSEI